MGDGNLATLASFYSPTGIAVDASGNLFIADSGVYGVRKINGTNGIISTVAGNGISGYSGDGGTATSASLFPSGVAVDVVGNLYVSDGSNNVIRKIDAATGGVNTVAGNGSYGHSGDGGPATAEPPLPRVSPTHMDWPSTAQATFLLATVEITACGRS